MRARVIYNPTSGKEVLKKSLPDVLDILESAGYEASAYATTPEPNSAQDEATRAAEAGFDLIVAAGGDGTINQVINGIAPLEKRPKLAILPGGTTNDYARALKIPRGDIVEAAKIILKNQTVKMDIGQAGEKYFMNIGAGGSLTELTYEVPSKLKSVFGYLAYLVKGAEMLPRVKPINMRLTYDDGVYEGKASMFFLGLTNSVGGFENLSPNARLDDGKFSLIVVKTANLIELLHLAAMVVHGGKHINDPRILYIKTSAFKAEPLDENFKMMINLDGEYGGDAPMTFINLRQHIEMFANLDDISDDAVVGDPEELEISDAFVKEVESLTNQDINGDGQIS
ncbi:diacylglycerol kinase [Vagococcus coleopterorum]|uniref:Diacylglycerol kinase n=2 Tax=Vagococcus coleopterorum TaxID=2714946 RepID=A0A6G8API9_9ENTE|nr:diacylglycerol kinase [Vagococcus coleopterorum]QIL46991.1 diacylglycerol kinase [Vagococcus coleopterorum]